MGHKVSPLLLRIGITKKEKIWQSNWFADKKSYANYIQEDYKIRNLIKSRFPQAAIARIAIDRLANQVRIRIASARPGLIIGKHGADIERLREELKNITNREMAIDIEEIKNPALEAQLVGENIAYQLIKRVAFRRAIKRAIEQTMTAGAKGIKVVCSGRLGGAEMSRRESYKQGKIPLATLRADIDYALSEAFTTYGVIGIKVWIYKGDVLPNKREAPRAEAASSETKG